MGYRSDVAYVIKFEDMDSLNAFKTCTLFEDKAMRDALADCETVEEDCLIRFHAESVKWYPGYEEVQAHERLIKSACDEPFKAGARVVRIGENDDDIETDDFGEMDWEPWDHIEVIRAVNFI